MVGNSTLRRLAGMIGVLTLLAMPLLPPGTTRVAAQEGGGTRWESREIPLGANRLYAPPSGALFASGLFSGLGRSNDGGRTWRSVPLVALPEKRIAADVPAVAIDFDPTNHAVAYQGGGDGLYKTVNDGLRWDKVLPVNGTIFRVAVSRAAPSLVYFALETPSRNLQIWRSRDSAASWEQVAELTGPSGGECAWYAPIFSPHPTDAARIFLQSSCSGGPTPVLASDDQGEHWSPSYEQPTNFGGMLVGGQGADPSRFYLLVRDGGWQGGKALMRSDDGARTWTKTSEVSTFASVYAMTYDPATPNRVYVGASVSEDGGATWRRLPTAGLKGDIHDLALGTDRRRLYAATSNGVSWLPLKEDGSPPAEGETVADASMPAAASAALRTGPLSAGSTWQQTAQTSSLFEQLIPWSGSALFGRASDGVLYRTEDDGTTWTRVDAPTKQFGTAIAIDPTDSGTIYVDGGDGIYKSENNTRTWKKALPLSPTNERVHAIAVSPVDRNVVFASVGSGPSRLLRSRDGGQSWEPIQEARKAPPIDPQGCGWFTHVLAPHPSDATQVFASTGCFQGGGGPHGALQRSADQGQTWTDAFADPNAFPTALVGGRGVAPDRFYLLAGNRLLRSDDGGASWADILVNGITALTYDPANPDCVVVGLGSSGVLGSADGGATWTDLGAVGDNLRVYDVALGTDGRTVLAATNRGVWRLRPAP